MTTGIFRPTAGQGLAFGTRQRGRDSDSLINRFAELLSQHGPGDPGGNVAIAAERLGKSRQWGNAMLQRIRRRLGPQAI